MNARTFVLAAVLVLAPFAALHGASPLPAYGATPLYDGMSKSSQYLSSYDGTKIAISVFRPTKNGRVVTDPLPVVVTQARGDGGQVRYFVERGYVWVGQDRRGTGASFGNQTGFVNRRDAQDAKTVIEWAGAQSFSNRKVVGIGCSNQGAWQYAVASLKPKYLVALAPACSSAQFFDDAVVYNGVPMFETKATHFSGVCDSPAAPAARGAAPAAPAPPPARGAGPGAPARVGGAPGGAGGRGSAQVDEDKDGSMLKAAQAGQCNAPMLGQYWLTMSRDSLNTLDNYRPAIEDSAISHAKAIKDSGIAFLQMGAWYDAAGFGQFASHAYWGGRVIMGPWTHGNGVPAGANFPNGKLELDAETLRFFDFHAKGAKNGGDKPSVLYYTINAPEGQEWRTTAKWRWNGDRKVPYYFGAEKLATAAPSALAPITYAGREVKWFDGRYQSLSRWFAGDMTPTDQISLSQTTDPLATDLEVTGNPTARFWISADTPDTNIYVTLADVSPDGKSSIVTDGRLRASWRKTHTAAWGVKEQNWHRGYAEDISPLKSGEAAELVFDLSPISYVFRKGHSVRVTIATSIGQKYQAPPLAAGKEPTIQLYRDRSHPSAIELPTVRIN
jgi:putative CocE/NonD family hydrolase